MTGTHLLGMWQDSAPPDPTDTPYCDILSRKSMVLEASNHMGVALMYTANYIGTVWEPMPNRHNSGLNCEHHIVK